MDNSPHNNGGQSVPPTLPLDMTTWLTWILNTLKMYGLPFVLLAVAVWYFHRRTEKLESAIEACQKNHLETVWKMQLQSDETGKKRQFQFAQSEN